MGLLRKRSLSTIVASAEPIDSGNAFQAQTLYLMRQNWQQRVWLYYDEVPEVHYASQYVSNALAKIKLVAAIPSDDPDEEPEEVIDGPVAKAVRDLKPARGGQAALLKNIGLNLFGPGEVMLTGHDENGTQSWEALSIDELKVIPGNLPQRYRYPGAVPEVVPPEDLLIRLWRAHPRFSSLADSALAAAIDQCEQLLLLTKAEKAAARSRFAGSGLLFIPIELIPPAWQNQSREQDPSQTNPLVKQLTEAMMEPLRDESHPSSVVPLMLFGPAEYGEKIRYMSFERPLDKQIATMKKDAIGRLAAGIDMPSEVVDGGGLGRTNHWSSMQIDQAAFDDHLQAFVELVCDALTVGYLTPALQRAGTPDFEKYVIWYNADALITKSDLSEPAQALHDRLAISDASLRIASGFQDSDAPTTAEYAKRVGIKLMVPHLALTGEEPPEPVPGAPGGAPGAPGGGAGRPPVRAGQSPSNPGGPGAGPPKQASDRRVTGPISQGPVPGVDKHPQLKPPKAVMASGAEESLGYKLAQLDQRLMKKLATDGDLLLQASAVTAAGPASVTQLGGEAPLAAWEQAINDSEADVLLWLTSGQTEALEYLRGWLSARAQQEGFGIEAFVPTLAENAKRASTLWRDNLLALARNRMFHPYTADNTAPKPGSPVVSVPPDFARKILLMAGGGTISPADAPLSGGVGTGRTVQEVMRAAGIPQDGYLWVYGGDRESFQGHLQLDGATFNSMTDPILHVWPEDYWLRRQYYAVGDHWGCKCAVAPNVP